MRLGLIPETNVEIICPNKSKLKGESGITSPKLQGRTLGEHISEIKQCMNKITMMGFPFSTG